MSTQVAPDHYQRDAYATMERFISYFWQIELIKKARLTSVLFIGVGDGLVVQYLKTNLKLAVTTYDFEPALQPDLVGDVRSLPFAAKAFDLVVAFEVLEHIPWADLENVLSKIGQIARHRVILSVPHRLTGLELVLKFPGIRSLCHRDWFDFFIRWPLVFKGFAWSGQHYWEIDRHRYALRRWRCLLARRFKVEREFSPPLDKFHRFFVLRPLGND